jgi:hypothetical protein
MQHPEKALIKPSRSAPFLILDHGNPFSTQPCPHRTSLHTSKKNTEPYTSSSSKHPPVARNKKILQIGGLHHSHFTFTSYLFDCQLKRRRHDNTQIFKVCRLRLKTADSCFGQAHNLDDGVRPVQKIPAQNLPDHVVHTILPSCCPQLRV